MAFACALVGAPALVTPGIAAAQVQPYGTNDYGGFRNVLPPGTNGLDNALQLVEFEATKLRPPHNDDQLQMYSSLTTAAHNIHASQIGQYFKDATFGVRSGNVQSTEGPEPGVTIVRDSQFGVPHIYGDTRAELMYGIGFATAEDRLFFIDALRHAGQGDLAQFAGGANVSMDESVWAGEPYTPQDLVNQIDSAARTRPTASRCTTMPPTTWPASTRTSPERRIPCSRRRRCRQSTSRSASRRSRSRCKTWCRSPHSWEGSSASEAATSSTTRSCTRTSSAVRSRAQRGRGLA